MLDSIKAFEPIRFKALVGEEHLKNKDETNKSDLDTLHHYFGMGKVKTRFIKSYITTHTQIQVAIFE